MSFKNQVGFYLLLTMITWGFGIFLYEKNWQVEKCVYIDCIDSIVILCLASFFGPLVTLQM